MATVKQVKQTRSRWSTSALVAGGMALSAFGLAGGIAEAAPAPAPTYHWCPGDQWDPGWSPVLDWNWNQCHDWQRAGGPAPMSWGPWGPPPPWAPPPPAPPSWAPGANVMWNQTARAWGFWNNGIWMTI
jgi:hypothetical protein